MSMNDADGASSAEKEIKTLEAEAARLDELADARSEHAREERDEAHAREDRIRGDQQEIQKRQEDIHRNEEEIARDEAEASREEDQARHDREEAKRLREEARHKRDHRVIVNAVVAGKGVLIEARENQTLAEIREEALKRTENVGQPPENWEIKDEQGNLLDPAKTLCDYHFGPEVTIYISLKAGAAGDVQTVDPSVSRTKFDREIELFRETEADYRKRGIFLIEAKFPKASFLIATTGTTPATIAAAIEIDFTDFDLRPASVVFVNPFSGATIPAKDMQFHMVRRLGGVGGPPDGAGAMTPMPSQMIIQANSPECPPFICLPGIREYHDNPAHSGDSWLSHRASGEGSLAFILDKIWMYGSNTLELRFQILMQPVFMGYAPQPQKIPA